MADSLATKKDLEDLKRVINHLIDTRFFALRSELEKKIGLDRTEVSDERSSDERVTGRGKQRKTLDGDELERFGCRDSRTCTEFRAIKVNKESLYNKLSSEVKDMSNRTSRQLQNQEELVNQLKRRCEQLERNNRECNPKSENPNETSKETDTQMSFYDSIKSELNSIKESSRKTQAETKQRLDNLEVSLKLTHTIVQDQLKKFKTFVTRVRDEIALQMMKISSYLKGNTQEIMLRLDGDLKSSSLLQVGASRSKGKHSNQPYKTEADAYQDLTEKHASHKSFYEEGYEISQDNKEFASIMKLEESIARSDAENLDEVRRMLTNNCTLSNTYESKLNPFGDNTENRTLYEEDKALLNFVKGPAKKEKLAESEGIFNIIVTSKRICEEGEIKGNKGLCGGRGHIAREEHTRHLALQQEQPCTARVLPFSHRARVKHFQNINAYN
eukprot:TRINITY_DN13193_c0_g3_i1.p1 TRINITY_DN13193_c0_g3~~TRINITY_DN13193_c0_g3_i1.p1  ORF type:complete len:443 (+),score=106.38 TRINITY_DN13193_c0_g3_i1:496-1824(+)